MFGLRMSQNAIRELVIILGVGLVVYAIAIVFRVFQGISAFAQRTQDAQVNELITLLLVAGACYIVFATLRWRELSREGGGAEQVQEGRREAERAQQEAERAQQEAEKLESLNRILSEADANIFVRVDSAGRITEANEGMESATGLSKDLLLGTSAFSYFQSPEKAEDILRRATEFGSAIDSDMRIKHRDGTLTPVSYQGFAYENAENAQVGVVVCRPRKD